MRRAICGIALSVSVPLFIYISRPRTLIFAVIACQINYQIIDYNRSIARRLPQQWHDQEASEALDDFIFFLLLTKRQH